jgi:hypothetical protein
LGFQSWSLYARVMTNPNPTLKRIHVNKSLQMLPQFAALAFLMQLKNLNS